MTHSSSISNEYARAAGPLLDAAPKTVWAAIAVSFAALIDGEEPTPEKIQAVILHEWEVLHLAKVVPQKPPKATRR